MARITQVQRWNAHGYEVTDAPEAWHETDVEVYSLLPIGEYAEIRRIGTKQWLLHRGTVPEAVRWWFSGENQER